MITRGYRHSALLALALGAVCLAPGQASARSAVYGGGPFLSGGQAVIDTVKASGFTTVVLWTIHVHSNGDLFYNDTLVVSNGAFVGDPGWPGRLASLKQAPTSVNRIEITVGSAGPDDWGAIHTLLDAQGTGSGSILFRNFKALKDATGADAINDDDEQHFDVGSTESFARMVVSMGYKFTLVPFDNQGFWATLKSDLGSAVDRVYLQCYAGGAGNDPGSWNRDLGVTVDPGLWSKHGSTCSDGDSPSSFKTKMTNWHNTAGITGGFLWLYDDLQRCPSGGTPAQYASAINTAVGGSGGGGGGAAVQLFQDCNFGGWSATFNSTGNISTSQIVAAGGRDNDASSIKIAPGFKVTLFTGNNQTGRSVVVTSSTACFVGLNFNDVLSSMKIEKTQ
jgi:hypothetical protein